MINYLYCKFLYILLLFSIQIKCEQEDKYFTHPMNIIIDSSNLNINNSTHKIILDYLEFGAKILSKILNCIDTKKIEITTELIKSSCKKNIKISKLKNITSDLIVIPIFDKLDYFERYDDSDNFQTVICELKLSKNKKPNISLFIINKFLDINSFTKSPESLYLLKLKILKCLTDCLGLSFKFRVKTRQAMNNFFETPLYLIENSFSYNSIKKLYKLSNIPIPERDINGLGGFYQPYWPEDYIIKDFRSEDIDINYDLTETSLNLFNDLYYYKLSKCDLILDDKEKCHRIDQKCIKNEEFNNNYYLQYGIYNSKIICYFSNKDNIISNQCGNKYGPLLNEVINYCPLIVKRPLSFKKLGDYEIPELLDCEEQELKLIVPSNKCHFKMPRTVFLRRDYSYNNNFLDLNDVLLSEENRRFFVTFQTHEDIYLQHEFIFLAKINGLIRSYLHNGNHNLFLDSLTEVNLKENRNNIKINKFQKYFSYVGTNIFSNKDSLYNIYKNHKKIFTKEYNFMQETYIYPEEKEIIKKKFSNYKLDINNLWIVKSKQSSMGNNIHIFQSLNNEQKEYIITKYVDNLHLIRGKKYNLRFYVLVSGIKPLRIYLNAEGLVRVARDKFSLDKKHLNNKYVHITNFEKNKEYEFNKNSKNKGKDKLYFNDYARYLKSENADFNSLKEKITDIIIKTVISGHEYLISKLDEYKLNDRNFFNLYGYDFLIDKNFEPYLIDISRRPDMYISDNIDKIIKERIFIDTLNIVGLVPFSHDEKVEPLDEIYQYDDPVQENVDFAFCELTRQKGNFNLIFPLKNNIYKYKRFIKTKLVENERLWEIIKNDDESYLNT